MRFARCNKSTVSRFERGNCGFEKQFDEAYVYIKENSASFLRSGKEYNKIAFATTSESEDSLAIAN